MAVTDNPWNNGLPHGGAGVTVVRDGEKFCNWCKTWRTVDNFQRDASTRHGYKANCRRCCTQQAYERRHDGAHPGSRAGKLQSRNRRCEAFKRILAGVKR